jgi:uncharacterized repeat protein (TIGR03803 family)
VRKLWTILFALVLATAAANAQTYKVLYSFGSHQGDPEVPTGVLAQGSDGGIYGTSSNFGGTPVDVFKFTPSGILTAIHDFGPSGGLLPNGVTLGTDGRFYGVIGHIPGIDFYGAVFKLTASGNLNVLHVFQGGFDGQNPNSPPVETIDGNFYGTTVGGGSNCNCGTLYKMTPDGTTSLVHIFDGTDGSAPDDPPVQAANGNLYGTTYGGGLKNGGTIFEISPSDKFSLVFNFHLSDGLGPIGALIQANDGNLYGTTTAGGPNNAGVVFKVSHGSYTVLHNLNGGSDGTEPVGGLVQATDGNLCGVTGGGPGNGTIFRISPSGNFATLYSFPSDGSMGRQPFSTLLQHSDGLLYGTTRFGGSVDRGVFFRLDIGAGPFVTFLPAARKVGHTVKILGQGFSGTIAVSFNGTPATTFTALTDTLLTAIVPNGSTTGFIQVTTPSGTLTSNKQFQVKPQVTSFSPTSGPVGTSVVITGVSLSQTSKITFGSVVATNVTVSSDTQVTVNVPAGATTTKIGLTTTGAPVYAATNFTVTQ